MGKVILYLFGTIFIGVTGWYGFWFYSINALKDEISSYIEANEHVSVGTITGDLFAGFPFDFKIDITNIHFNDVVEDDNLVFPRIELQPRIFSSNKIDFIIHESASYQFDGSKGGLFANFGALTGSLEVEDVKRMDVWKSITFKGVNMRYFVALPEDKATGQAQYNSDIEIKEADFKITGNPQNPRLPAHYILNMTGLKFEDDVQKSKMGSFNVNLRTSDKKVDFKVSTKNYAIATEGGEVALYVGKRKFDNISVDLSLETSKSLEALVSEDDMDALLKNLSVTFNLHDFKLKMGALALALQGSYKAEKGDFDGASTVLSIMLEGWDEQAEKMLTNGELNNQHYLFMQSFLAILQEYSDSDENLSLKFEVKDGLPYIGGKPLSELLS